MYTYIHTYTYTHTYIYINTILTLHKKKEILLFAKHKFKTKF